MSDFVPSSSMSKCGVTYERFELSLRTLGVNNPNFITSQYSLEDIEAAYESHLDVLKLERDHTPSDDDETQIRIVVRYKILHEAYEDVREYLEFQERKRLERQADLDHYQ
jgi:hypothetical protein